MHTGIPQRNIMDLHKFIGMSCFECFSINVFLSLDAGQQLIFHERRMLNWASDEATLAAPIYTFPHGQDAGKGPFNSFFPSVNSKRSFAWVHPFMYVNFCLWFICDVFLAKVKATLVPKRRNLWSPPPLCYSFCFVPFWEIVADFYKHEGTRFRIKD